MKWIVDQDHPSGWLVPMTEQEQAQYAADQAEGAKVAQAAAAAEQNAATMTDRTANAIGTLEDAAASWGTLTAAQKDAAMKLTVQVVVRLARLVLHRLDTAA